jgi:VWFA-related protein
MSEQSPYRSPARVAICHLAISGLILSLLGPAGPTRAQDRSPDEQDDEVFFESIEVNVVNVEVYVTDKQGNRVAGLEKEDFELYEDGRRVEISNFYAVRDGRPVEPVAEASEEKTAIARPPMPLLSVPEEQRLHLVIYFDNLFLRPFNRNKLIDQVRRFIYERVGRQDSVMLITFDRSIHIRHPFTTDHGAILEELDNLRKLSAFGVQQRTERRDLLRRIDSARSVVEALDHVDFYAKSVDHDLQQSIGSLDEIVGSLAGLSGRKAILYVSDGIPMTPAEDLFFLVDQTYTEDTSAQLMAARYRARRHFNRLTARANTNRVSFYTVEAAGLTSHESLSAEFGQRGTSILEADVMRDANREEPLVLMADRTGGLSVVNTNNFEAAFDRIGADFRNYYSLGYTPTHAVAGRYHDIEVKLKRPGLKVRHRTGYRDKTTETRVNDGTLATLIHGVEKNPLGIHLETGTGRPTEQGRFLVPLVVRIPLGNITLLRQGESHRGKVRVSIAVIADGGGTSSPSQTPLPISIPDDAVEVARQQDYVYEVELLMRRGFHVVAVGVRDDIAGDTSFVRHPVRVGI